MSGKIGNVCPAKLTVTFDVFGTARWQITRVRTSRRGLDAMLNQCDTP